MSVVWIAIDTPDLGRALAVVDRLGRQIEGVKLGLEFFSAQGPAGVTAIATRGVPIFLDLKLHDIPQTVANAVRAMAPIAPAILTVHAGGGHAMMAAAKAAAPAGTRVVAVTVLTSLDAADLTSTGIGGAVAAQVARLATMARAAGLDGVVCSGNELATVRELWPDGFLVVPGVRLADDAVGDQKRVVTPRAARDGGASVLVIGRPITAAPDMAAALAAITASL